MVVKDNTGQIVNGYTQVGELKLETGNSGGRNSCNKNGSYETEAISRYSAYGG